MGKAAELAKAPLAGRSTRSLPLLLLALFGACASPGPPRPPSLNLPEVVTAMTAARVGGRVELRWTTPEKTTDGLDVRGPMSATICRKTLTTPEQGCAVIVRLPVVAGASEAADQLPPPLIMGSAAPLEYRVEIFNTRGRSAGQSPVALAAGGPAPRVPEPLQIEASPEGAVLRWSGDDVQDAVELRRSTLGGAKPTKAPALGAKPTPASDLVLRVPPGEGGLDRTAIMGERYTYTAQRVRTVSVAGRALEVRSNVSPPASLEMRDVFPPRAPTGLEAVADDRSIDLSWEPNTEPDLAGYFVVRQENGSSAQLNPAPVLQPAYRDKTASPGHAYRYIIVAVDRSGNRSPGSEPAQISIHTDVP